MSVPPCIIGACDSSVKLEGLSIEQLRIAAAVSACRFWMSIRQQRQRSGQRYGRCVDIVEKSDARGG